MQLLAQAVRAWPAVSLFNASFRLAEAAEAEEVGRQEKGRSSPCAVQQPLTRRPVRATPRSDWPFSFDLSFKTIIRQLYILIFKF
jgi:hypothetical protein